MARASIKTPLENVKKRAGFTRRWVSSREFDMHEEAGFAPVKDGSKNRLNDPVVDDLVLMEIPDEKMKDFEDIYQGREEHRRLMAQVTRKNKVVRDSEDESGSGRKVNVGSETVDIEVQSVPRSPEQIKAARDRKARRSA